MLNDISAWWLEITSYSNLTDRQIFTLGTCSLNFVVFWTYNLIISLFYKLKLFQKYLIQPGLAPESELVRKTIVHILVNQLIGQPILVYVLYPVFVYFGMVVRGPLPSVAIIMRDFAVALFLTDTIGYWVHRMMHHKSVYKYWHKQHHTYKVNIPMASVYAHTVEDLVSNTTSSIAGCMLLGSHVLVLWAWLMIRLIEAMHAHCGYHFYKLPHILLSGGEFHEFHHSHNVGNYGTFFTFWDHLMGTDRAFLEYRAKKKRQQSQQQQDQLKNDNVSSNEDEDKKKNK